MSELIVSAFFSNFTCENARTNSFGIFFSILLVKMPGLLVLAFFLKIFMYKNARTNNSGVFLFLLLKMPELIVLAFFQFYL
jgi:hypothetical protein